MMMTTSWKVLTVALVLCVLLEQTDAQRNNRARNSNGRGNRNPGRRRRPNRNRAIPGCEPIQVPMCRGLVGYTHTKLPNRFNHTSQLEVYRVLEHLWAEIDTGCSRNLRLLACSLYLPKCVRRGPGREPCRKTCKQTKRTCERRLEFLGFTWPEQFDCLTLPKKRCLKHVDHRPCLRNHTECVNIDVDQCQGFGFTTAMSPNMFGQCYQDEIDTEMQQFEALKNSSCSADLPFFLCGAYMNFCDDEGIYLPCKELCQQVRSDCEGPYTQQTGLPWPNKFQCHRYPTSDDPYYNCVMPSDVTPLVIADVTLPSLRP